MVYDSKGRHLGSMDPTTEEMYKDPVKGRTIKVIKIESGDCEMNFCCNEMKERANYDCTEHNNKYSCPVCIIEYNEVYDEYGIIIHDGGASCITINYCPWCGSKLPESKRDLWFEKLEELRIDDPLEQDIPNEFRTKEWYSK